MSSNVNLVDKLNPIYFEQNDEIKITPEELERLAQEINKEKNNKKEKENNKDTKVTISSSETELKLIQLEALYNKCLSDLEMIEKTATKKNEINETKINEIKINETKINDDDQLNAENSVKKKLFLNTLLNFLPNFLLK